MWAFFVGNFMAIQTINLTVPGGDTPRSANTKINANFSNTTHAASRLVGTGAGNVMAVGAFGLGGDGLKIQSPTDTSRVEIGLGSPVFNYLGTGLTSTYTSGSTASASFPEEVRKVSRYGFGSLNLFNYLDFTASFSQGRIILANGQLFTQAITRDVAGDNRSATWGTTFAYYHTGNTTIDAGTGFLKVSSPVLHVYNDKIDKIHEAEQLDITVDKKGVGHYEIHGTTGLRQNDGWNMSPPRDIHGNVRCMIEVTEKDGVITVKTYKRKFDLELAAIVHDYDNPLDIPEGACVELRFNDLPQDDIQTNNP